jgi:hypothetical protein
LTYALLAAAAMSAIAVIVMGVRFMVLISRQTHEAASIELDL